MPLYHLFFGHLLRSRSILSQLLDDVHGNYLPDLIKRASPDLPPMFYLDDWPFTTPILEVTSPTGAYQVWQDRSLPKFAALRSFMKLLTGGDDLVTMEGKEWKAWRSIFNLGFSHLKHLFPRLLKILPPTARSFSLEMAATNVTMGVISRVSL